MPFRKPYYINGANRASRQRGFSLVELMVAIALGLLILAGMLLVFANASSTRSEIDRNNRQIENGRYATELLRDDVQLAGFLGEADMPTIRVAGLPGAVPDPCATALTERTNGGTPGVVLVHVQGVDNYTAGSVACLNAIGVKPGTDVILVRRAKTCLVGSANCETLGQIANKPALQVSLCSVLAPAPVPGAPATHTLAVYSGATAAEYVHRLTKQPDCTTALPSPLRPYVIYMYFVGTDHILKRVHFVNGQGMHIDNVSPVVDGIENLQVEYGVDTNNDGNADVYRSAADINALSPAADAVAAWSNVVTVKIHVLARSTEPSLGFTDTKTYRLGTTTFTPNSANFIVIGSTSHPETAFRRHVYSSLVRITNVSARREIP